MPVQYSVDYDDEKRNVRQDRSAVHFFNTFLKMCPAMVYIWQLNQKGKF